MKTKSHSVRLRMLTVYLLPNSSAWRDTAPFCEILYASVHMCRAHRMTSAVSLHLPPCCRCKHQASQLRSFWRFSCIRPHLTTPPHTHARTQAHTQVPVLTWGLELYPQVLIGTGTLPTEPSPQPLQALFCSEDKELCEQTKLSTLKKLTVYC